jgi:aryl-phospho-beta-D-glucosidase BglC (GH1 family)
MDVSRRTFGLVGVLIASALVCSAGGTTPDPFLAANGVNIRNGHGSGDIVPLHGANLGTWLLMEGWMCPMDSSGLPDNYSVIQTLDTRFGVPIEQNLIRTYQNTWITTNDLDNIRALGMNLVRVPFWWADVQTLNGTWRADAFDRMDWVVSNAWQRGIYTLIDFHGVPGGQSTSQSTGQQNQNQYWTNSGDQNQTALIWSNVAAHFKGNAAVAGYDLMNEPIGSPSQAAIWAMYSNLYQTVRAVDPDHILVMEGTWTGTATGGQQLNWQWDVLPPPGLYNWSNVAYSMHAYPGSTTLNGVKAEVDKQVNDFNTHQSWNVPDLIGEFNAYGTAASWQYAVQKFNSNNMSWANWAYKATDGTVGDSWGIYDPISSSSPSKPNIQTDSSATISNDWSQWKTVSAFGITAYLQQYLGEPLAVADSYTATSGVTLAVSSGTGVLANDLDINNGQPGIQLTAVLVNGPANGQLTLNPDGSFSYTSTAGFSGTDRFRYSDYDGYADSVNIVAVTIQVNPAGIPPGWSDEDIGSPSLAGQGQYSSNTGIWTMSGGGGTGIGGTADQFNYLWEDYSGDGNLIAEVTSLQNTDPAAKAGVMFRSDDSAGSAFADVVVIPGNGVNFEWRSHNNGQVNSVQLTGIATPVWVMLTRSGGSSFSGYYSLDGTNWTQIGSTQIVSGLSTIVLAGLVVTSHNANQLATATFANVSVTPLSAWQQWQMQYFGSVSNPMAAPDVDADGDGQSNWEEFLAGTDPTNGASYLHITSVTPQGNAVAVAWMCGGGTTNVLQASSTVTGTYSNVSSNMIIVGSGVTTTNYLDTGAVVVVSGGANDNASAAAYTGGNFNGANSGTGFGAWVVSPTNNTGNALWFIASSTTNGVNPSLGIDSTGNKSWGSFANNGATGTAVRVFSAGALVVGQTFTLDMDNGYVESSDTVGFDLQNTSGQTLLEINYIGMNAAGSYGSIDNTGAHSLGVSYTDGGVHAKITLTSATTYSASLTPAGKATVNFSGTLINAAGGRGITQIRLFDNNVAAGNSGSHWDVFWNNFNVSSVTNTVNASVLNDGTRFYRVFLVP